MSEKTGEKEINLPEISLFRKKLYEKIDKSVHDLIEPFIIFPSQIKEIDPKKRLEEARRFKNKVDALEAYREAALAALFKKESYEEYFTEYLKNLDVVLKDYPLVGQHFFPRDVRINKAFDLNYKIKFNQKIVDALIYAYEQILKPV